MADQVSLPETVTVTETYSMSVALVADQVSQKEIVIATETYSMSVVFVMDLELSSPVDVQTKFLKVIATVMEMS